MKGVLICGGSGTRLRPLTEITNKSLLPVYDKPLIHYPLEILLKAGIKEIAIITGPEHMDQMKKYLGSGEHFGCTFSFAIQEKPAGIAQALGLAETFAQGEKVCALLGDNVFFDDLTPAITSFKTGGHLFIKEVNDPERFGVVELDANQSASQPVNVLSIEEKPTKPKSNMIATGCYLFDEQCFDVIKNLKPSARGELEITDVSAWYLEQHQLTATILQNEWIDAGTFDSLHRASCLVKERIAT